MIRGYVSSDEDDYDDYDFGYSEPLILNKDPPKLPEIQTPEIKEKLQAVLEESQKIELFLKAVSSGDLAAVEKFIKEGLPADSTDSQGWTALMRACGEGKFDMVEVLLENGADPNKHRELLTPLMTCCTHTLVEEDLKLSCVRLLLNHGAQVNAKDKYRTTALMYAAGSGYESIVTELLEVPNIQVNIQDKDGWTALFHAVNQNKINIVKKLMSAKTNLELKDRYQRTAVNLALDKDLKEVAKVLGYVEKKPPKIKKKKKKLKRTIERQLPDSNGVGGFCGDSHLFLMAFNQKKMSSISFPDLLNATDKDLLRIGIKLEFDRYKILSKGIHQYHLHPWKTSSMKQINWNVPLSLEDIINITASLLKHLTIANASLRYVSTRVSSRQNKKAVNLLVEKDTIIFLIKAYESVEKIESLLQKILLSVEKIHPEVLADHIYPCIKEKNERNYVKYFWRAVGAATAGFLIFYYKSKPNIRTLMRFASYPFTTLLQLFEPESVPRFEDIYDFQSFVED